MQRAATLRAPLSGVCTWSCLPNHVHASAAQVHWHQIGLPAGAAAAVRDLYAERDLGVFTGAFTATVTAHDVVGWC